MAKFRGAALRRTSGGKTEPLDRIALHGAPFEAERLVPLPLELHCLWARNISIVGERERYRLVLVRPDGSKKVGGIYEAHLADEDETLTVVKMNGMPVREAGIYHFAIELPIGERDAWLEVGRAGVEVVFDGK